MTVVPLRIGYEILDEDTRLGIEFIKKYDIARFKNCFSIECTACGKENELLPNDDKIIQCDCGKRNSTSGARSKSRITSINVDAIISLVNSRLNAFFSDVKYDSVRRIWVLTYESQPVHILLPEISNANSILSSKTAFVSVILDSNYILPKLFPVDAQSALTLYDLEKTKILEKIQLSVDTHPKDELRDITVLEASISALTPVKFENFCIDLFNELKKNGVYSSYLRYLFSNRNSIVNSKIIKLGGASLADYQTIDIHDYLKDAFNPDRSGEVKHYLSTQVTLADFEKAIRHAKLGTITLIASTNKIQRDVWTDILDMKARKGFYYYILIDKELLIDLLLGTNLDAWAINFLRG